jgi:branched-chain amino acid transport system substrate-binding protein
MTCFTRLAAAAALAVAAATPSLAADLKIGVISSMSGPISALGIPYAKGIQAAAAAMPEVAGHKVQVIMLDDASDPTTAARNARKLVAEDKVDVLIGTSGVPGAMAIAAVAREMKTPLISPTPVKVPPDDGGWTVTSSQPFPLMVAAVVERMKKNGVKTVAFIGFSDALGDLAYDSLLKAAGPAGIKVVSNERYARSDTSVAGQILKIVSKHPDAVFAGNSGSPGALPYLALANRGYHGGLYGTHGLINADFVRVGGDAVNGLMVPSGPVMVADQLGADNPVRQVALKFREVYKQVHGAEPVDAFSAYTYDAYNIFADAAARALKSSKAEPGTAEFRAALKDAIASTHELAGAHGVFTFHPNQPYGLDKRSAVVIKLDKGHWRLVP